MINHISARLFFLVGILIVQAGQTVFAGPKGAELLGACTRSLTEGFEDLHGSMCTWYITPCDCNVNQPAESPAVCLPDNVTTRTLAETVVRDLSGNSELQTVEASLAAVTILSRVYPCTEEQISQ